MSEISLSRREHAVKNSRLPWKFHSVKKFIIAVKIFHAVKIFSHREINNHAVKVFHPVKNVQVLAVKKCHAVKKVTVSGENPLPQSIVNILLVFSMQISEI